VKQLGLRAGEQDSDPTLLDYLLDASLELGTRATLSSTPDANWRPQLISTTTTTTITTIITTITTITSNARNPTLTSAQRSTPKLPPPQASSWNWTVTLLGHVGHTKKWLLWYKKTVFQSLLLRTLARTDTCTLTVAYHFHTLHGNRCRPATVWTHASPYLLSYACTL
jgi:hypothetical protein